MARRTVIRIDLASPVPAYRQIVDAVRVLLVDRTLKPGDRLPSVRDLAMDLGVHFNTVGQAYRELSDEGWLDLRHGRGATVIDRAARQPVTQSRAEGYRTRLKSLVAQMRAEGFSPERISAELQSIMEALKK